MNCPNDKCGRLLAECGCCLNCFCLELCEECGARIDAMNEADYQQAMEDFIKPDPPGALEVCDCGHPGCPTCGWVFEGLGRDDLPSTYPPLDSVE